MSQLPTTENNEIIRTAVTLTEDIARSIVNSILSGERYYDREGKNIILSLPKEDGTSEQITFSANTYDNWIRRESIIPNTNKTLKSLIEQAREKRREIKEKKADAEKIALSELALKELLSLPIHSTRVDRILKRDVKGKMREVQRVVSKDISAPLVHAKVKSLTFALERLNPSKYGEKGEVKHLHAVFSLADLRKHKEEQRQSQQ